jgi:hypothetical protein
MATIKKEIKPESKPVALEDPCTTEGNEESSPNAEKKAGPKEPARKGFKRPTLFKGLSSTLGNEQNETETDEVMLVFTVFWCKYTNKKHKTMDDGVLFVKGNACSLFDMEGKLVAKTGSFSKSTIKTLAEVTLFDF